MELSMETRLRAAFQVANERQAAGIDDFLRLYHDDVHFEDPLQRTHGKEALAAALRSMYRKLGDIDFQMYTFSRAGDEVHFTWTMRFRPRFGPRLCVNAASHLRLRDDLILYHRDYWDLLSSMADASPLSAQLYRAISRRLA